MKSSAPGLAVDGSKDDKISCFHEGNKTSNGRKSLENQIKSSSTREPNKDPFMHTDEDIIAAAPSFTIIDENDDERVTIEDYLFSIIINFDFLAAKKSKMFG